MAKKRRNSGRAKPAGARGRCKRVRCEQSGVLVPKDKAVKRFIVRNIVDASAVRDIQDASAIEGDLPSPDNKTPCMASRTVQCAISRVRVRRRVTHGESASPLRAPSYAPAPISSTCRAHSFYLLKTLPSCKL